MKTNIPPMLLKATMAKTETNFLAYALKSDDG